MLNSLFFFFSPNSAAFALIEAQTIEANGSFYGFSKCPQVLLAFESLFPPTGGLFLLFTYRDADSKFTKFQRIHLLLNRSLRRQVSPWILSALA